MRLARFRAAALCALWLAGCNTQPTNRSAGAARESPAREGALAAAGSSREPIFVDGAKDAGLRFVHANGATGGFYMPEILAPGVALFDYDNDGDLDAFVVQGRPLSDDVAPAARASAAPSPRSTLYRNDLHGAGESAGTAARFTDVTAQSGIDVTGYAMGVAAGDIDNDGCVNLFVTAFGESQLFRNRCDGTFADVTKATGLSGPGWAVSASFADFDRDGWLDLYVGHYLHYAPKARAECRAASGEPDYCTPQAFRAQPDRLYRNTGNGRFADVSRTALVGGHLGPALGVATADFDNDGWVDIFVANDGEANQLWMNRGNGTFVDHAPLSGVAVGARGAPEGNMGVDAGDVDNDGDEDLFDTVLPGQGNNLWVNDGTAVFEDQSTPSRLGNLSLALTGFGAAWIDYDKDGWLDLLTVNGAVSLKPSRPATGSPYAEPKALFRNLGNGRFEDVTARAGPAFALLELSRGAAFGDVDNDGDTDVLVGNNNGPLRLLLNNVGSPNHWLGLNLVAEPRRPALGARVSIRTGDGRTLWRRARSDGSYASANNPRVLVGLGSSSGPIDVKVVWPTGQTEEWTALPIDRYVTLEQGRGHRR